MLIKFIILFYIYYNIHVLFFLMSVLSFNVVMFHNICLVFYYLI